MPSYPAPEPQSKSARLQKSHPAVSIRCLFRELFMNRAEGDVVIGPGADVGDFLGAQVADDFRGGAHDEGTGRNMGALGDEGVRADDAALADDGAVEDGGAHADEAIVLDGAGVENRAVSDGDEFADAHGEVLGEVDDAAVLDVGAFADFDVVDVAAEDGGGPDAAVRGEADVADDDGLGGDVGGGVDLRGNEEEAGAVKWVHDGEGLTELREADGINGMGEG